MSPPVWNQGIRALLKQGWNEIPEVMGASVFFVIGVVGSAWLIYDTNTNNKQYRRYKDRYLVYRPDDPKLKFVKRGEDSPPVTKL